MHTPLVSVKELAAELGVRVDTIRRAMWKRIIPSLWTGKLLRFDADDIRKAAQQHAHQGVRPEARARIGDSRPRGSRKPPLSNTGALSATTPLAALVVASLQNQRLDDAGYVPIRTPFVSL